MTDTAPGSGRVSRLRRLKLRWLSALDRRGVFTRVRQSRWRSRRLAILCYHGVSKLDEHLWNDELFVPPVLLQQRLELLQREGCGVCSLGEGLRRVRNDSLPGAAVALTFDDGVSDFHEVAWPILAERGMAATVYLTSFYSGLPLPVFGPFCTYVMWKGRGSGVLDGSAIGIEGRFDLSSATARGSAAAALRERCRQERLCAARRHEIALRLAELLGVDVEPLLDRRLIQIMSPEEIAAVSKTGADVQLHTHRHRLPFDRTAFDRELLDNQTFIERHAGRRPWHFCYPSGEWRPELFGWLRDFGVESAVVGEKGYVTAETDRMALPRFADTCAVTDLEFRAWITGAFQLVPRRPQRRPT